MPRLAHLQRAFGWALAGLLGTYLLINAIGFASPFWGAFVLGDAAHRSHALLRAWQPITPWFSLCFAVAAWHLARGLASTVARVAVVILGVLVPVAHVGAHFARTALLQASSPNPPQVPALLHAIAQGYIGLAAIGFIALAWWSVRQANREATPCA